MLFAQSAQALFVGPKGMNETGHERMNKHDRGLGGMNGNERVRGPKGMNKNSGTIVGPEA